VEAGNNIYVVKQASRLRQPVDEEGLWSAYRKDIIRRVKRTWFPPRDGGPVLVDFAIKPDGSVSGLRLSGSSGCADCDKQALKAVANASPFGTLPLQGNRVEEVGCSIGFGRHLNKIQYETWEDQNWTFVSVCLHLENEARLNKESDRALAEHRYSDAVAIQKRLARVIGLDCVDCRRFLFALDGYAWSIKDNKDDARKELYSILSFDDSYAPARMHLDAIIRSMGKDPGSFDERLSLAREALKAGKPELAYGEYREALHLQQDWGVESEFREFRNRMKSELLGLKPRIELESQLDWWQKFVKAHPESAQGHMGLSETLQRLNRKHEAETEYKKALFIDPGTETSREMLEDATKQKP